MVKFVGSNHCKYGGDIYMIHGYTWEYVGDGKYHQLWYTFASEIGWYTQFLWDGNPFLSGSLYIYISTLLGYSLWDDRKAPHVDHGFPPNKKDSITEKQRFYWRQCWLTQLQGVALISLLTRNAQLILFRLTIGFIVDIVDGVNIKPRNITRRHLNIWELTSKSNNWNTKNVGMSSWYVI